MDDDLQLLHDIRQSPTFFSDLNETALSTLHTSQIEGNSIFHWSKTKAFTASPPVAKERVLTEPDATISLNSHQYGSKQIRATSATGVGGPCSIGP